MGLARDDETLRRAANERIDELLAENEKLRAMELHWRRNAHGECHVCGERFEYCCCPCSCSEQAQRRD